MCCLFYKESRQDNELTTLQAHTIILISVSVAIMSLLIRQYNDADTWWQVAIGKDILATMSVPRFDHFTAAGWGRPYHDSHWLFQSVLAAADHLGGTIAVGLIPAACWTVTFIYSYRSIRNWLTPALSCLLLFVLAIACNARFIPRPDIVTCLMIAMYYHQLQVGNYRTYSQLFFFGVFQIVWSNSHGLFVIGPFMAFCYLMESLRKGTAERDPNETLPVLKLFSVLIITSFCTPFGLDGWYYALKIAQEAGFSANPIYRDLNELKPVISLDALSNPDYWSFYLLIATMVGTTITSLLTRRSPFGRLIIVLALFAAACSGRRNMPLFALAAAPFIAESVSKLSHRIIMNKKQTFVAAILLITFASLPLSGMYYRWFNYDPIRFGLGAPQEYQPSGLPDYLQKAGFNGQIYNNDLFGGYLMYRGILPLFDGRWEIYDLEELTMLLNAPFDPLSWRWVENRFNVRGALLRLGEQGTISLVMRFMTDGSYRMVYNDRVASFWIRNTN